LSIISNYARNNCYALQITPDSLRLAKYIIYNYLAAIQSLTVADLKPSGSCPLRAPLLRVVAAFMNIIICSFVVPTGVVHPGQIVYPNTELYYKNK
jgi:hypothetical protein